MADNQRDNGNLDFTNNSASAPPENVRRSSAPPQPVSPFQPLKSTNEPPIEQVEKNEGPIFPVVEKKPSFTPKPSPVPVLIMPIQQVRHPSIPPSAMPPSPISAPPAPVATPPTSAPPARIPPIPKSRPSDHDDDGIFDLSDEMVVDSHHNAPFDSSDPPSAVVEETSEKEETASPTAPVPPRPPVSLPIEEEVVFDDRDTVVDSVSKMNHGTYEEAKSTDPLPDDRDFSAVSDLFETPVRSDDAAPASTERDIDIPVHTDESEPADSPNDTEEDDDRALTDEEELDISDVEEMPRTGPPALPTGLKDGRKPIIRRRRKQNKEWWARIFNDDYVSTIPKATVRGDQRKVNFIEKSLMLPPNSLVLDLACGNGRHSVGMAKRGYRVVGIDLSLPMLAQAAELAQDEHQNINFIHGDMRDLSFDKTFDAVFCMGTSFGYFDDETNAKVMHGVFRALKPGGSFLLEVSNRDHIVRHTPELTWFEGNGSICMEETAFDYPTSRLVVTRQLIMDGGRQVQNDISIRVYSLHEIEQMLISAGFELGTVSGHPATPGAFFGPDSVRIFMCAKRPK